MAPQTDDQELLQSFKEPATRERAFTGIIKNTRKNFTGIYVE